MERILIIQTASIGDVILTTPVLEYLHEKWPGAAIDMMVKRGCESLFAGHPFLDTLYLWNKQQRKYRNLFHLLKKIRAKKYDMVVNVQRFAATGFVTAFSGAPVRIGFNKNPFSFLFTKKVKHHIEKKAGGLHEVQRNLNLVSDEQNVEAKPPRLYPAQTDFARMSQFKTKPYICIAPASLWFTKQFPAEMWVEFLKAVDPEIYVYLLGAANDHSVCEGIINESGHGNCFNFSGKLSLLESAALMRDAVMNFVNDSSPMHLASAMNAKITAIYCSTIPEFGFGPLSNDAIVVQVEEKLACRPCGLHGLKACPEKHFKCAKNIQIEKLLKRL